MSLRDPELRQMQRGTMAGATSEQAVRQEVEKLAFLIGTWAAQDKYEKTALNPNGGEGSGTYQTIVGPGGFSLLTDYHYEAPHGQSSGHQVLIWDAKLGRYTSYVVSSSFPGCLIVTGQFEGSEFVLSGEFEARGKRVAFKQIFSEITHRTMILRQYNSFSGGASELFGTTLFTKK